MGCKHERLRTVGDRVFCCICGEELPLEFLTGSKPAVNGENQAKNPPEDGKPTKSTARKRTAKKAD